MSLSVEEIQKTLAESMMSMQTQMEAERKGYKEKIKKLEDTINDKEEQIKELLKKKSKDAAVRNLEQEVERLKNEYNTKYTDYQNAILNVSTLKNQLELKSQNIMQLNLEKRQLKEKLDDVTKQNDVLKMRLRT